MPHGAPEYHYVLIDYVCRVTGGTPAPATMSATWSGYAAPNLPNLQITEGTLAVIEKAFRERRKYNQAADEAINADTGPIGLALNEPAQTSSNSNRCGSCSDAISPARWAGGNWRRSSRTPIAIAW